MSLTDLVKGFQVGWKYSSKENQDNSSVTFEEGAVVVGGPMKDYVFEQIFEEQAPQLEVAGFYAALVVKHPHLFCKEFYRELRKDLGRYLIK